MWYFVFFFSHSYYTFLFPKDVTLCTKTWQTKFIKKIEYVCSYIGIWRKKKHQRNFKIIILFFVPLYRLLLNLYSWNCLSCFRYEKTLDLFPGEVLWLHFIFWKLSNVFQSPLKMLQSKEEGQKASFLIPRHCFVKIQ